MSEKKYQTFSEFYPFYLAEHSNSVCRALHFIGTALVLTTFMVLVTIRAFHLTWIVPLIGYGFAWVGHFGFEKNRPATFKYPLFSFRADFVMFWQLLTGKLNF